MSLLPTSDTNTLLSSGWSYASTVSNAFSNNSSNATSIITSLFSGESAAATISNNDLRIKLTPKNMSILGTATSTNPLTPIINTSGLIFQYTPNITINASASYSTQVPTHSIQDYKVYQTTPSTSFSITCDVTAQSLSEAEYSAATLHFLRLVTKSRFGKSSSAGLPPPVLVLTGYGDFMFDELPVIVDSYSFPLPNNVDYVNLQIGNLAAKIPTLTTMTVNVTVQNTPDKLNTFNIDNYADGQIFSARGWF